MNDKHAEKYVLLIVVIIGILGLCALFSSTIQNTNITGAAIQTAYTPICSDNDGLHAERKGSVSILYGSVFPDQCYTDKTASEYPVNKGNYLREYYCNGEDVNYQIYYCGTNDCQYGACISTQYSLVE
ncbi:MAG: hypothetical protein WC254_02270 [Candidatus Woesearchaeota archaeon]